MFDVTVEGIDARRLKKTVVLFATDRARLLPEAGTVDRLHGGAVRKALKESRFRGGPGECFWVTGLSGGAARAVVVGLGKEKDVGQNHWRLRGIDIGKELDRLGVADATVVLGGGCGEVGAADAAGALLEGMHLALYRFDRFRTGQKRHQRARFKRVALAVERAAVPAIRRRLPGIAGLLEGSDLTRDLVNLPPNIALPDYMAREARKLAPLGVRVSVLGETRLRRLGLNLMLAVGEGASPDQQPCLILMEYRGAAKARPLQAVVGKGVMFDTGGYNLKPTGSMESMKCDMAGAGAVMGLMKALALRKSPVNVLGACGCAVNMVSDRAYLPSSILTSYQGITVEVGNTDAEGRLVLADAMAYVVDRYKPSRLVDLATLTGACMVALGGQYAGLFSSDDTLARALLQAGGRTGERLWRMPIDEAYAAKPKLADASNDGKRYGGASTGAVFLKRFVGKTPWAHLDIAGVALSEKVPESGIPVEGATGFGVRLLVDYLEKS